MKNPATLIKDAYLTWDSPISLVHFITLRCNARCKHCFIDFNNPEIFKDELKIDEIREMSKHLGNSLLNVNLTGGEPFFRRDVFEIAEAYFTNAKIQSLYITMNGYFTDRIKEFIDKFLASGIEGKLIFALSIDNFEEKHNENRRVKGLFQNALKTYGMIKGYNRDNILADIALTVTEHNYESVVPLYHYLKKEHGVDAFTASAMREEGIIKSIDHKIKAKIHKAYVELTDLIREDLIGKHTVGFKETLQGKIMNAKNLIVLKILQKIYARPQYISHCPAGALFGVIYGNGDVYPCEILSDRKLGNVRDYGFDFMKLWRGEAAENARVFIKDTNCNCTYECAWSLNIVGNWRYIPKLIWGVARGYLSAFRI